MAVASPRAQTWKPVYRAGVEQLSLGEIRFLVLPDSDSKKLASAIQDLQSLFLERYGKNLQLAETYAPKQSIHFETHDVGEGGAFSIQRERRKVVVRGADAEAWANAIYELCFDMLGARWYWAGEYGFEWVEPAVNHFSASPWVERPTFVQRRLYPVDTDFGRRNRLNNVYSFNHNLGKIFTPELYKERPEVFAELNGRRKVPAANAARDPQPHFAHPLTVEIAAQAALDYFEKNPERTSYSLSINDNVLFDTSEATEAIVSPLRYFRDRPNYTDLVFGFMNQVAERVFEQAGAWQTPSGEPRYITALAYYWTEPAPSMPLHPRVMPVLTADRAQWHDPDFRAEDKVLIEKWAQSGAERIATWDYYFGAPFIYPRQFNQWIDESLKHLADSGVDVLFSQLPSFWGLDGAKSWLAAELLWDPRQDAQKLLDEYYQNFFGAAAESMRAFYEIAEAYRNEHEGKADWVKLYKDEAGIALFSEQILAKMRAFIERAKQEVALDERRLARVQVVSDAFRLTELYERFNRKRQELVWRTLREPEKKSALRRALADFQKARDDFQQYREQYATSSSYAPNFRHIDLSQSDPEEMVLAAISGVDTGALIGLSTDPNLKHEGFELRNFLGPELPKLTDWNIDYRPSRDFAVLPSEYVDGESGIRIVNADILSLFRIFPAISKREYALRMKAGWKISLDNRVHVHVAWLDRDGKSLGGALPLRFPIGETEGPLDIHLPLTAPEGAYDVRIRIVLSRQYPGDYLDISELDFVTFK